RPGQGRGGCAGRGARGAADPRAGTRFGWFARRLPGGGLRGGNGLAVRLALRAAVVRRAGLGAARAGPAGPGRCRGGARLDRASQDRRIGVRLPAGPAGRRGAAGRPRLAAAGDQARGDAGGAGRGHRMAGARDGAGASRERPERAGYPSGRAARGDHGEGRHDEPRSMSPAPMRPAPMSTATGAPAAAATGRRGPAGWPRWAVILLAVLAWIAALAAIWPLVR